MLTQELVKAILDYNPETGALVWKVDGCRTRRGSTAGFITGNGYLTVSILKKPYRVTRIIWLYMYNYIPEHIDHINNNRLDNRLCNLRECTRAENNHNTTISSNNTTGIKGISLKKDGSYEARVSAHGVRYSKALYPYNYSSKEECLLVLIDWLQSKRLELHGEFTNHG
jgi:hypothetical protein